MLFSPLGSWECRRESKTALIVVSDSTSSSGESYSSGDSSSSNSDTEGSVLFSSRRHCGPSNYCLIVSIPLSLIKCRLKLPPGNASGESSPNSRPSIEKLLGNSGEPVLSPASLKGLRMPLSLKLKRMSATNNYAVVSSNVNGLVTSHSFPVTPSCTSATACSTNASSNASTIADGQSVALSESHPLLCTSTATSNVGMDPVATSASVTASSSVSDESMTKVSESVSEHEPAGAVASLVDGRAHEVLAVKPSDVPSEGDPLISCSKLHSKPAVTEDTSAALPEPGAVQVSNCYPVGLPMSPLPGNEESSTATGRVGTCQSSPINSRPTVEFSFSRLFSFYPCDLKLQDNKLVPVYSLSLKNADTIPDDHPVYTWTIGQAVETPRKRKRKFNH